MPQYDVLTVEKILEFLLEQGEVEHYLPDDVDLEKIPRQWLVNVASVVIGTPFREWVSEQIEIRNAEMANKKGVMIHVDPQILERFHQSSHVSCKYQRLVVGA